MNIDVTAASSADLLHDFNRPLAASSFIGYLRNETGNTPGGLVLRCLSLRPTPCTEEEWNKNPKARASYLILGVPHAGWCSVPYKASKGKPAPRDPNAKRLYEITASERVSGVTGGTWNTQAKAYSFEKASSNTDKGKRDDELFSVLRVGYVFTCGFFEHNFKVESSKVNKPPAFPPGVSVIPAYTIVDVHVSTGHNAAEKPGYGLKLNRVVPHRSSLYSYMFGASLGAIPASMSAAEELAATIPDMCKASFQCFEQKNRVFFAADVQCYTVDAGEDSPFIRLCATDAAPLMEGGSMDDVIDVPIEVMARYLNAPTANREYCARFLGLASAAHALSLLVVHDEYLAKGGADCSTFQGVPLVDVDKLMSCVDAESLAGLAGEDFATFSLNTGPINDIKLPALQIALSPLLKEAGEDAASLTCMDLSVCHGSLDYRRGYKVYLVDLEDGVRSLAFMYVPGAPSAISAAQASSKNKSFKRPFEDMD